MEKILLVEDDKNAQELYQEILTTAGYSVDTASDGEDGLQKIQNENYDLIFLDIMLPKMDGLSVLSALSKDPSSISTKRKIVILSNLTHDPVVAQAMSLGACDHISKPSFNPEQFISKVQSLLK